MGEVISSAYSHLINDKLRLNDDHLMASSTFNFLITTIIFCLIFLWLRYIWNRRKWYICANKLNGPLSLPIIGCSYLLIGDTHEILIKIGAILSKYKGLVRFWHCNNLFLATCDPKHLEIILNHPKALAKDKLYQFTTPVVGWGLFTAPVHLWKRNRKLLMPAFNQKILDGFVEVFAKQSSILVNQIEKNSGQENPEDVSLLISRCTLDIICETAMGIQGVQAQTTQNEFGYYIDKCMEIVILRICNMFYQYDFIFKWTKHHKELEEAIQYVWKFTMNIIKQKRAELEAKFATKNKSPSKSTELDWKPREKKTFLNLLLEMSITGQHHFSDIELYGEIMTFMVGGSDTTAYSNCFTLLMMAMHPEVQLRRLADAQYYCAIWVAQYFAATPRRSTIFWFVQKIVLHGDDIEGCAIYFNKSLRLTDGILRNLDYRRHNIPPSVQYIFKENVYKEVMDVVGPDCEIEPHHLPNLPYLERVIKETLRLFPVGVVVLRSAEEDIDLRDGNVIPEGSCIVIGMLAAHRSPDNWPQPLVFDPDRFLPDQIAKIHPYAYIPFSAGPRNCIGLRYGMMAMKTLIATVVRSFVVTTTYRSIGEIELKVNIMLRPKDGFKIAFHRR